MKIMKNIYYSLFQNKYPDIISVRYTISVIYNYYMSLYCFYNFTSIAKHF